MNGRFRRFSGLPARSLPTKVTDWESRQPTAKGC
jgi:hypothetical protein